MSCNNSCTVYILRQGLMTSAASAAVKGGQAQSTVAASTLYISLPACSLQSSLSLSEGASSLASTPMNSSKPCPSSQIATPTPAPCARLTRACKGSHRRSPHSLSCSCTLPTGAPQRTGSQHDVDLKAASLCCSACLIEMACATVCHSEVGYAG